MSDLPIKSALRSQTIQGISAMMVSVIGLAYPLLHPIVEKIAATGQLPTMADWVQLVSSIGLLLLGLGGGVAGIQGRFKAKTQLFTPDGLPGANLDDLVDSLMRGANDAAATFGDANPDD